MRFLKYGSLALVLAGLVGCVNNYNALKVAPADASTILSATVPLSRELYRATVNGRFLFKKFHLSGLLLFKKLDDRSTRVVFTNESGFSFFDFSWSDGDSFRVAQIIPQLDKKPVIATLRKDIELLLYKNLDRQSETAYRNTNVRSRHSGRRNTRLEERWHRFALQNGYVYYVLKEGALSLIETSTGRKRVTSIHLSGLSKIPTLPDSISIVHHRAHFTISAKKIQDTDAE